jgi:hypothetical protein
LGVLGFPLFGAGKIDNIARAAVNVAGDAPRLTAKVIRLGAGKADNAGRLALSRVDDLAELAAKRGDDFARLGLKQGDNLVQNFSGIHRRINSGRLAQYAARNSGDAAEAAARRGLPEMAASRADNMARATVRNAADPALEGMSREAFKASEFITSSGKKLDGKILHNDIHNYSLTQYDAIIAAKTGKPMGNVTREINGIPYQGEDLRRALCERFDRVNDYVGSHRIKKDTAFLQGGHMSPGDLAKRYGIEIHPNATPEEICESLVRNGKTSSPDLMTSTFIDDAVVSGGKTKNQHALRYALETQKGLPASQGDISYVRHLAGKANTTKGCNITNQCNPRAGMAPGYFLMPTGVQTRVTKAVPETISETINGHVYKKTIIHIYEEILP